MVKDKIDEKLPQTNTKNQITTICDLGLPKEWPAYDPDSFLGQLNNSGNNKPYLWLTIPGCKKKQACWCWSTQLMIANYLLTQSVVFTGKSQTKTLPYWPSNSTVNIERLRFAIFPQDSMFFKVNK